MTLVRRHPASVIGPNAATLPTARILPAGVPLAAMFLPETWDAAAKTWEDYSGNGHDLVAAGTAPAFTTEGGRKFLRFSGTQYLAAAAFILPQPFTWYAIAKPTNAHASGQRSVITAFNLTSDLVMGGWVNATSVGSRVGTTDTPLGVGGRVLSGQSGAIWETYGTVFDGANSLTDRDGAVVAAPTWGTTGANRLAVGTANAPSPLSGSYSGDIAAIAVSPVALDATQRAALKAYMQARVTA